jgi:hypothetical protein
MKVVKRFFVLLVASVIAAGALGCEREGPVERTGENIDRAIDRSQDRVGDSLDREGPAERAGERMGRPVDRD